MKLTDKLIVGTALVASLTGCSIENHAPQSKLKPGVPYCETFQGYHKPTPSDPSTRFVFNPTAHSADPWYNLRSIPSDTARLERGERYCFTIAEGTKDSIATINRSGNLSPRETNEVSP